MKAIFTTVLFLTISCFGCQSKPSDPPKKPKEVPAKQHPKAVETIKEVQVVAEKTPADHELSFYETFFEKATEINDRAGANENIKIAVNAIDGIVLKPGDFFSYNETLGERTEKRGFKAANVIFGGVMIKDIGGGICQVSSTLHPAVLLSGIKPTKWRTHTRELPYVKSGLDAAIAWPNIDYAFENTYDFPIQISAKIVEGKEKNSIQVRILGQEEIKSKYTFKRSFKVGPNFEVKERTLPWFKGSFKRKVQDGKPGKTVWVSVIKDGDVENKDMYIGRYRPQHEIWDVGPEWNKN